MWRPAAIALILLSSCSSDHNKNTPNVISQSIQPVAKIPPVPIREKWTLDESRNEMDGTKETSLSLFNDNASILIIRCNGNETDVFVNPGGETIDNGSVRIKFDDSQPIAQAWHMAENHSTLFSPEPVSLSRRLAKSRSFLFEYKPYAKRPRTVRFDVSGLDSKLGVISKACNWESTEKKAAAARQLAKQREQEEVDHQAEQGRVLREKAWREVDAAEANRQEELRRKELIFTFAKNVTSSDSVFCINPDGKIFHIRTCLVLRKSATCIRQADLPEGFAPCSVCNPKK